VCRVFADWIAFLYAQLNARPAQRSRAVRIGRSRIGLACSLTTCLLLAVAGSPLLFGQSASQQARIVSKIDESHLVTLKGNTLPVANAQNDRGPVASTFAMNDLVLVLQRSPEQQAAFDQFVADQYDPSSPEFHHWLSAADAGARFGPSQTDISTIVSWMTSHGLAVTEVAKDCMSIRFNGTAAQVQSTFHTQIHNILVNGLAHIANMSDPQIPAALGPVVSGIKALNDFRPHPLHRLGQQVVFNGDAGKWQRIGNPAQASDGSVKSTIASTISVHPDLGVTIGSGTNTALIEDVTPYDFATIYNVLPLWSSNIDGTGQTIAIAGTSDINTNDVATFRSAFGLPAAAGLTTIVANGVDPGMCESTSSTAVCGLGDLIENTLDVEWAGAVAKGAKIALVVSGQTSPTTDTVYSSASYVIQNDTAKILNVSYGLCELFQGTGGNAAYNNLWETAATEGIAVFVASGDSGSPACDQGLSSSTPYGAAYGLSVSGLASTPYNTAVGGTDFAWCKPTVTSTGNVIGCSTASPYWNTTNSSNYSNVLKYVPEVPWNDSCASDAGAAYLKSLASFLSISGVTDAESACNFAATYYATLKQQYGIDISAFVYPTGAGGGASNCTVSDGNTVGSCTGGYAKPSWQSGVTGILSDGKRDVPDVSFFASNGFLDSAYVMCVSEDGYTCTYSNGEPQGQEVGGTSVASPAMAGVMALINQQAGSTQGSPNAELYRLGAKQNYATCTAETATTNNGCYFNDIDRSTISMPCRAGAPNCTVTHTGDTWGVLSGYSATTGYDAATGLGSLNVANVVNSWTATTGTAQPTVTVAAGQTSILLNQSLTVNVTVGGSGATPTGTVSLVGGGYTATVGTLSSGTYSFTIPADSLTPGKITLTVSYSGDAVYALATGTVDVTVAKLTPTVTVQPNPATVGANTAVNVAITVSGGGPAPTGTVQLSGGGYTSSSCTLTTGICAIIIPANSLNQGTDTLTVSYSGDGDYNTATGTATETVNALTPTISVVPSLTTLDTATALQVTVKVTGSGATPTGEVILSGLYGVTQLGGGLTGGSIIFNVPAGTLAAGTDTLTVNYQGDTTYLPASGATTVSVSKTTPVVSVTPAATSIYTNAALSVSGTVTGAGKTPTGSVTLAGGGYALTTYVDISGTYNITIPAGRLATGTDTLTATYSGDAFYTTANNSATVTVNAWTPVAPTITLTPSSTNFGAGQALTVTAVITGSDGTPTGTISLSGAGYNGTQTLSNGRALFVIGANTISPGTYTLTANYNGDATYLAGNATTDITVTQSLYQLAASTPAAVTAGSSTTSTITVSSATDYDGTVSLSCALTSSPSGASNLPTCSGGSAVNISSLITSAKTTVKVNTTAATQSALARPKRPRGSGGIAGGGALLAVLFLAGLPERRRRWRALVGVLVLLIAFGGLSACGGGSSGSSGGTTVAGTTPGAYTFTVTGTGNPAVTPAPTATFTVTVN